MALYVLYGHQFWARKKLNEFLAKAEERGGLIFRLSFDKYEPFSDYLSADLFGKKVSVVGEALLENLEYERELNEALSRLAGSENLFFLLEEELSEEWRERFRKGGARIEKFQNPPVEKFIAWAAERAEALELSVSPSELKILAAQFDFDPWVMAAKLERMGLERIKLRPKKFLPEPNYFQFADLAGSRDKYDALRLLGSYVKNGFGAEEAFWKLWWKVKTLRMVDAEASGHGLHPFVLKRAAEDVKNFSSEELKKLSYELMDIFSEDRRGEATFEEGLERLLLKL